MAVSFDQRPPAAARARFARYHERISPGSAGERLALALEAWWGSLLGEPAETAAGLARRALADGRIFAEQPDSPQAVQATLVLIRADELEQAERATDLMLSEARDRGSVIGMVGARYPRGNIALRRGDLAAAEVEARSAVEAARLGGFLTAFSFYLALLIDVLIERGEVVEAEQQLAASGLIGELPNTYWFCPLHYSRGCLRLAQTRTREGVDDLLELTRRLEHWGLRGNLVIPAASQPARALAALGEPRRPRAGRSRVGQHAPLGHPRRDRDRAGHPRGRGRRRSGRRSAARSRRAARALARPARARARPHRPRGHAAARRPPKGRWEPLRAGFELARRCGALPLAKRAHGELGAARREGSALRRHRGREPDPRPSGGLRRWPPKASPTARSPKSSF